MFIENIKLVLSKSVQRFTIYTKFVYGKLYETQLSVEMAPLCNYTITNGGSRRKSI